MTAVLQGYARPDAWQAASMLDLNTALNALPGFPQLQGARVRLRGPRVEDVGPIFALFSDPRVMRYWSSAPMLEAGQAESKIAELLDAFEKRERINWLVTDKEAAVIGTCALFHFDAKHRRAEIGYALHPDHWGKGLASEAVALAIDWGFRTLGLHRIEADIDPRNESSRRTLERLGFSSEGLLRERFFLGDEATDSEIFGLLAQDWREG